MAYGEYYFAYVLEKAVVVFYCDDCFVKENDQGNIVELFTHLKRLPAKCQGCNADIEGFERLREDD